MQNISKGNVRFPKHSRMSAEAPKTSRTQAHITRYVHEVQQSARQNSEYETDTHRFGKYNVYEF